MFSSFIDSAKLTVSSTVSKYVGWAAVGLLLIIAASFGLAAIVVELSKALGPTIAYALVAAVFALLAALAIIFVVMNDRHQQSLIHRARAERSAFTSNIVGAAPLALAGGMKMFKGRVPLLIGALVIGAIVMRSMTGGSEASSSD